MRQATMVFGIPILTVRSLPALFRPTRQISISESQAIPLSYVPAMPVFMRRSTLQLLRIPFSIFLMPVYFFALSQVTTIIWWKAILIFLILHLLIYPASNGYNSYMDRDEGSIGLLEHPLTPTRELFHISMILDTAGLILSTLINVYFFICVLMNILASKAYSYRGIRLKKYPYTGFLTVILFQGAVTFFMVYCGSGASQASGIPWLAVISSSLLFGCFYPLTQIYQHEQDLKDGVVSISYKLGYRGTFVFTAGMFLAGDLLLLGYFRQTGRMGQFILLEAILIPVLYYFINWFRAVLKDRTKADYRHTMQMNVLGAVCTNLCFIILLILNHT